MKVQKKDLSLKLIPCIIVAGSRRGGKTTAQGRQARWARCLITRSKGQYKYRDM